MKLSCSAGELTGRFGLGSIFRRPVRRSADLLRPDAESRYIFRRSRIRSGATFASENSQSVARTDNWTENASLTEKLRNGVFIHVSSHCQNRALTRGEISISEVKA